MQDKIKKSIATWWDPGTWGKYQSFRFVKKWNGDFTAGTICHAVDHWEEVFPKRKERKEYKRLTQISTGQQVAG